MRNEDVRSTKHVNMANHSIGVIIIKAIIYLITEKLDFS